MIAMKTVTIANTSMLAHYNKTNKCGVGLNRECKHFGKGYCTRDCEFPF